MAISRIKNWSALERLDAGDLNAEFNNFINNALGLISPWTGNMNAGGFSLIGLALGSVGSPSLQYTGDTNTGWYSRTADTINATAGGVLAAEFGAQWILAAAPEDARTATVDVAGIIRSTTSGVPAAGIGVGLQFDAESADENPAPFGRVDFTASDIGAGTEDTYMEVFLRVAGAALTSCYRFAATGAFNAIFTHANTAARTYTFQDSSDTIVGRATTDTLTNKTLTNPVITVTSAAPATPTANVIYTESFIRGWVETSGGGAWTIDADLNVSSITDNGTGDFTINWATAFTPANYAVVGTAILASGDVRVVSESTNTAKSSTAVRMQIHNGSGVLADPSTGVSVFAIGAQ